MALPDRTQPWPPKTLRSVFNRIDLWGAWYAGEAEQLQRVMGGGGAVDPGYNVFGEQTPKSRAGFLNRMVGWFWSSPKGADSRSDVQLHIPVASDIAAMSADLIFGEAPNLKLPEDAGEETKARLTAYQDDGLLVDFREGAEVGSALGGVYLRIVWNGEVNDKPWIQSVHPDMVVPEFQFGRLRAATFWREILTEASGRVVRHLERHEPGWIYHGVYDGTSAELGRRVPLTDFPETFEYAELVDEDSAISTEVDELTVVYVPNVRPNRLWRNIPDAAYFGRSDFAGIEQGMDRLDMVWSSWMRDIRLGLARLVVPQSALASFGPGQGGYFDLDRELLVGLDLSLGPDESSITQVQFKIRHEEHAATTSELLEQVVRGAGYSIQTFNGETEGSAQTATEVSAKEKRTLTTRDRKIGYWGPAITRALRVLMAVDVAQFGADMTPAPVKVEFPDAVSDPPETVARTLQLLSEANAISQRIKVAMLHEDWTPTEVDEEVARIKEETPVPPAPAAPGAPGVPGNQPPAQLRSV
jgi:hypothetical protein